MLEFAISKEAEHNEKASQFDPVLVSEGGIAPINCLFFKLQVSKRRWQSYMLLLQTH